jgi:hypothetical protein
MSAAIESALLPDRASALPSFVLEGQRIVPGLAWQGSLARAHAQRWRPRCLCSEHQPPMVVARLGPTYILKRMPGTGDLHARACMSHGRSFQRPTGSPRALPAVVRDPETGRTSIRVSCRSTPHGSLKPTAAEQRAPSRDREHKATLSLRELLLYLWEQAGLTQWHPRFAGKRTWAVVRSHLLRAAVDKTVNGRCLSDMLYVPEMFSVQRRELIEQRRREQWREAVEGRRHRMLWLIAEVKKLIPEREQARLLLKHLPNQPFALDAELFSQMRKQSRPALSRWTQDPELRLALVAKVELDRRLVAHITDCALLLFSPNWLPVTAN